MQLHYLQLQNLWSTLVCMWLFIYSVYWSKLLFTSWKYPASPLIQNGHSVTFVVSKSLAMNSDIFNINESCVLITTLRRWRHYITEGSSQLIMDQHNGAFIFHTNTPAKISMIRLSNGAPRFNDALGYCVSTWRS